MTQEITGERSVINQTDLQQLEKLKDHLHEAAQIVAKLRYKAMCNLRSIENIDYEEEYTLLKKLSMSSTDLDHAEHLASDLCKWKKNR